MPGGADIQYQARGVTPASDVTDWVKVRNNTGITAAAGWYPVLGSVSQVLQMP